MTPTRFPAEWENQSGLLLTWPHPESEWSPYLPEIEPVYADIVRKCVNRQTVIIACLDEYHKQHVKMLLQQDGISPGNYRLYIAPSNDSWTRDHGPITLFNDNKAELHDFTFNGWGNKYPYQLDNVITQSLHKQQAFGKTPLVQHDFILEGGSLETDGEGTLLTTGSCLLSPARNKSFNQQEIESFLCDTLHLDRILWLYHGQLIGDDTDGHIDTLVRFARPDTLLYVSSHYRDNPNHESLKKMESELKEFRQSNGKPYQLIPLPSPVIKNNDQELLPASYANFLFINEAILLPVYQVNEDNEALEIFQHTFRDRTVIPVNCRPVINQFGSLHCITMQLPRGVIQ